MKIMVINGSNIQLLGVRKPDIYGDAALSGPQNRLETVAKELFEKIKLTGV